MEEGKPRQASERGGAFGVLHRIDDAIFVAEELIVVTFLIAMAATVFLDVVSRRLDSQDSKVGAILARIGGVTDEGTRAFLDGTIAPWLGGVLGLGLLWFAFWTAERHKNAPLLPIRQGPLVLALVSGAAMAALGWLMLVVASKHVYLVLYAIGIGFYAVHQLREKKGAWQVRLGAMVLVVTPLFVYFALAYIPDGYTFAQELSLMLLLWIGFLGASICAHEGKHLKMEAFDRMLPERAARYVHAAGFLFTAVFCAFMAHLGYRYVFDPEVGMMARGVVSAQTHLPDWISTVAVPIAFALTALRFIAAAVSALLGGTYGATATEDSLLAAAELAAKREAEASREAEEAANADADEEPS